ncbi:MAG: UPF0182 family protein [Antricoccus sp.]
MAVRPPATLPNGLSRRAKIVIAVVVALAVIVGALGILSNVLVDFWWYQETGFTKVFWTTWQTRTLMFTIFGVLGAAIIVGNALLAYKLRPSFRPMTAEQQNLDRYREAVEPRRRLLIVSSAIVVLLFAGYSAQASWQTFLQWQNSTPFGKTDPQFGRDLSFYTFDLPFYRFVLTFLFVVLALAIIAAAGVHYLYGGLRINSPGQRLTNGARGHLTVLIGVFLLFKAVGYWFDRYDLLFSNSGGSFTGASNSDVNALLPAKSILAIVAIICAIAFFANIIFKNFALPAMSLALMVLASLAIGWAYPGIYNRFVVAPTANEKQAAYISRNIEATSDAYGISNKNVKIQQYPAASTAAPAVIKDDKTTIPNARLLDPNVISDVVKQTQQVRNVYGFSDKLDIDRYTIDGKTQDYIVAVRELDPANLTDNQQNWINLHTVYTHGYGFIAAPANEVDAAGLPKFVNDGFTPGLIKVDQPRIYYGELDNDYAIVGGSTGGSGNQEFDRPSTGNGDGEVKSTYAGKGGVPLSSFFRKTVFAIDYAEGNFILNNNIGSNSKVIYNRDPRQRVEKAAPFLTADGDPYPAVVDGRIVWIVDAYTTNSTYPYAQQESLAGVSADATTGTGTQALPNNTVNYIRNSVKATVDAYDGTVKLYQFDNTDPVLKTWMKAYPGTIQPKSSISPDLAAHFRYPEDLFKVQRSLLAKYHVTNPSEFYSAQDFWKVPNDPTTAASGDQPPYYVTAQLPGQKGATFQVTSALTALKKENLTAYVSASSDPATYGQINVLRMPQDSNIYGPAQVQSQFRGDPVISAQLSLLDRGGSKVIYGNLLTLPVAGGLLYVEPLYVQGDSASAYPTLQKVLLNFGTKIAYADSLADGLNQLFGSGAADTSGKPSTGGATSAPAPTNALDAAKQTLNSANGALQAAVKAYDTAAKAADPVALGQAQKDLLDASGLVNSATTQVEAIEAGAAAAAGTVPPGTTGAGASSSSAPTSKSPAPPASKSSSSKSSSSSPGG